MIFICAKKNYGMEMEGYLSSSFLVHRVGRRLVVGSRKMTGAMLDPDVLCNVARRRLFFVD
jgi:hypothetical protein